ncbi:MAG: Blp family class II bacteriocin [Streptococcus sp.]
MTTQTMNNFETLDLEALANVEGGDGLRLCRHNWMALVGSAGGPVGYWGGALVGYATFANI